MIFQVSFNIVSPIVSDVDIHFDGIMYAISPVAHNKTTPITRFTKSCDVDDIPIPVDCVKIGKAYMYCCSTADFINPHKIVEKATKRKDLSDFMYYNCTLTPSKGIDKDCVLTLYGISTSRVDFFVSSSSRSALERYCKRVHNIGGMRKQGYGEVNGYNIVERDGLTWQDCIVSHGFAIRNIPQIFLENKCESAIRYKPPFWLLDGKVRGAKVGDKAILKSDIKLSEFRR